jgi:DNA-binding NarL/FixJ family response regulator
VVQVPAPTTGPAVLRVSIGEDDVLLREGIARILTGAGFDVVAQAGDADELSHRSRAQRPDVAIVDVQMPPRHEDDGLLAAIELRHRLLGTGVLILSQFCEPAHAVELISEHLPSALLRYESEQLAVVVAAANSPVPVGLALSLHAGNRRRPESARDS